MSKHPAALAREGITPERYQEMLAICRQYRRYKNEIRLWQAGLVERPRRGRGGAWRQPDPTGNAAAGIADATSWERGRVRLIEETAQKAAGSAVAPAILENVTEGRNYDCLRRRPPCGRRQFYICRLGFFLLLDARLREHERGHSR